MIYHYVGIHVNNKEDVEDLIQESILSVWLSLKSFRFQSTFQTWVIGIVRHKISDYFRAHYKRKTVENSGFAEAFINEDETDKIISRIDAQRGIDRLNITEREIVFLSFAAQLTYAEISDIIQIPVGTIKSKMSTIKNKLRRQLQEGG